MNQIDDIIARFGRAGWLVQKTNESYWTVRPKGTYNHKLYLLTYNPFEGKFRLIPPRTPQDPHYERALKILDGDRAAKCDRQTGSVVCDLSIIKVPSMYPIKIDNQWINLAAIMTLKILFTDDGLEADVVWENGDETSFTGKRAAVLVAEYEISEVTV